MCPGNLTREAERGALIRCLSHLTWIHSIQSRGGSIDDRASHPFSDPKPRHPIFWPLVFMISFLQLLATAFHHRWTEACLSTGKIRALPFGSFTTMCQCRTSVNKGNKCQKLVHNVWGESLTNRWAQCVLRGSSLVNAASGLCLLQVKLFCWLHKDTIFQSLYRGLWPSVKCLG